MFRLGVNIFKGRRFYSSFNGITADDIHSLKKAKSSITGPLKGLRVLDLTRVLAGPYCTMMLGDLGAEIIKIERPGTGDDTRQWGPPFTEDGHESAYFLCTNRSKKSLAIDLKHEKGIEIIKRLVGKSDIVIDNFLPGKMDQLGLGYESVLCKLNPMLIYCSLSGFGADGPYAYKTGYDVVVQGMAGLMHMTGEPGREPVKVGVAMTDLATGLFAMNGIMAALFARSKSGVGQRVDCSLLESQVALLANIGSNYLIANKEASRYGTAHESLVPYQAFNTQDGQMTIAIGNDRQFQEFAKCIGELALAENPLYITNANRVVNRDVLIPIIQRVMQKHTTAKWIDMLEKVGIPCGPINSMKQVFNDPQVLHRKMVQVLKHPTAGEIKVAGIPVKYSSTPAQIQFPPPLLGQHTKEILKSILGFKESEIDVLVQQNIVQSSDCKF